MRTFLFFFGAGLGIFFAASEASALCPGTLCSPTASTYLVRQSCGATQNCFESMSVLSGKSGGCVVNEVEPSLPYGTVQVNGIICSSNGWLWSVRQPHAGDHVTIDVGSGVFEPFICPVPTLPDLPPPPTVPTARLGNVTVRGQGQAQSRLRGSGSFSVGIDVFGCESLVVTQLTAEGNNYGVRWIGGGEGAWSRVDMIANRGLAGGGGLTAGWADNCYNFAPTVFRGDTEPSTQNIFDTRSMAMGPSTINVQGFGYNSECAETYYFGGQLVNTMNGGALVQAGLGMGKSGTYANEPARFFMFGTQVLVDPTNMINNNVAVGIDVEAPNSGPAAGDVHVHDSMVHVNVDVATGSANAIGYRIREGAKHYPAGTQLDLHTENGQVIPLQN